MFIRINDTIINTDCIVSIFKILDGSVITLNNGDHHSIADKTPEEVLSALNQPLAMVYL